LLLLLQAQPCPLSVLPLARHSTDLLSELTAQALGTPARASATALSDDHIFSGEELLDAFIP